MPSRYQTRLGLAAMSCAALLLTGCAAVSVSTIDSSSYMQTRRGDVISTGAVSQSTHVALRVLGVHSKFCTSEGERCARLLEKSEGLNDEQRLSASAELWMTAALREEKAMGTVASQEREEHRARAVNYYLESARQAYAYLFYTERGLEDRALEDRQNQVRDFYNFSTQQVATLLFELSEGKEITPESLLKPAQYAGWLIRSDVSRISKNFEADVYPARFDPDTRLTFDGLKNQYVRDGLGARMVLTFAQRQSDDKAKQETATPQADPQDEKDDNSSRTRISANPWRAMPYVPINTFLRFPGNTLAEVLATNEVTIESSEPSIASRANVKGLRIPLAANYSAAYGLWLANSNFSRQSLGTVFGRGDVLEEPRVYLMQPYRPDLKTIILVHGLASSPEAWVNTTNEIVGDYILRKKYQIWQIYYPTSVPIPLNRYDIQNAIRKTLDHYDPHRVNPASKDIVLIGHSMGGILSRLLVSESEKQNADRFFEKISPDLSEKSKRVLRPLVQFSPLEGVTRAVFIAAPHRGTPFADRSFAKFLASLVKLPFSVAKRVTKTAKMLVTQKGEPFRFEMTGVSNLSAQDPAIRALAKLSIDPKVKYHTIVGRVDPKIPVPESSDGIVPYSSSHWDGALSELVVTSGHSVQETPEAIIEIRRILHEHLKNLGLDKS